MTPHELLDRAMADESGFHCLPVFTKQLVREAVRTQSRDRLAKSLAHRLGMVEQFIEPLAYAPGVPRTDPTLTNLPASIDFIVRSPYRTAHRGAATFISQADFALCCTEMALLRTVEELALALGVEPPDEFGPTSWLDWAIQIQPSRDFVSTLYCLASAWAYPSFAAVSPERAVRIEADIMGTTGAVLHFVANPATSVRAYEAWLGCSIQQAGRAQNLRTALGSSRFALIDRVDTAAQLVNMMVISLMELPDRGVWHALALLGAWLDIPLSTSNDSPLLQRRIADSAVTQVNSERISHRLRTLLLDVVGRTRGAAVRAALAEGLRHRRSELPPQPTQPPLAEFNPVLLHLRVTTNANAPTSDTAAAAAFAHEYCHFVQTVATTYNHDRLSDVLNFIGAAVGGLGGDTSLMIHGLNDVTENFLDHLSFHRTTLDGHYPSHAVPDYHDNKDLGWVAMNEKTLCYEYVRWNPAEETFFATPLAAHGFQETLVFLNEQYDQIRDIPNAVIGVPPDTEPVESATHAYTAAWDLFFRSFRDHDASAVSKMATLAAVLDLSLHLGSPNGPRENWVERTNPSIRFVHLFQALGNVPFVDPDVPGDYERFVEDLCSELGWPSHLEEVEEAADNLARLRAFWTDEMTELLRHEPTAFDEEVAKRVGQLGMVLRERTGLSNEDVAKELADYERALRGCPLASIGVFGLGLIDYLERALRLRLEDPWAVILPYRDPAFTFERLPVPTWFQGSEQQGAWDARTLGLLQDADRVLHLYAVAVQWEPRKRRNLPMARFQCGFRLFGIPCRDPVCQQGGCPDWTPGSPCPAQKTGFAYALNAYGLFPK